MKGNGESNSQGNKAVRVTSVWRRCWSCPPPCTACLSAFRLVSASKGAALHTFHQNMLVDCIRDVGKLKLLFSEKLMLSVGKKAPNK